MGTLKEFYNDFGRTFPLAVVKLAYDKVQNGQELGLALHDAANEFAIRQSKRPLNHMGYTCVESVMEITVYKLQTETCGGLRLVSPYTNNNLRELAIAKHGENCDCDVVAVFVKQPDSMLGSYTHRNCCACVVRLGYGKVCLSEDLKLKNLADILAKNAMAWWPEYLKMLEEQKNSKKFADWLMDRIIRFVPQINEGCEVSSKFEGSITIGNYLQKFKKHLHLSIESINIYGI